MESIRLSSFWRNDSSGELTPTWAKTPNLSVIKSLAMHHLPQNFTEIHVDFFAEGAFNKLYSVRSLSISQQYIMRVTLPVEPFFKTESECATLAYIRMHTSIPIPKVIAYSSTSENELGFEWMLIEKINGIPLSGAWESMNFESKVKLSNEMSRYLQQLSSLRFDEIGNLYFSTIQDKVNARRRSLDDTVTKESTNIHDRTLLNPDNETGDETEPVNQNIGTEFVIGRIVSPWFFRDKRVLLSVDRGPFSSSYELMMAKMQIQIERIKHLSPLSTDEYYSETDEELAKDQDEILRVCHDLKELIPDYFSPSASDKNTNTLYHADLSDQNIIIDPSTYTVNGIVDWESVSICPSWETSDYPNFLKGIETKEPPPIGTVVDEEAVKPLRMDWEKVRLRETYLMGLLNAAKGLNGIPRYDGNVSDLDVKDKRWFADLLSEIEFRWTAARHWIPRLRSKDLPSSYD